MICDKIKEELNISYYEANNLLYHSKLYEALEDESTKMWYYSNYDLFLMFLEERKTDKYIVYGG